MNIWRCSSKLERVIVGSEPQQNECIMNNECLFSLMSDSCVDLKNTCR